MLIKILGSGCPNCVKLEINTKKAVAELALEAVIEKITDMEIIIGYGIMSTPALVVDEKVLSYGRIPDVKDIKEMLSDFKLTKSAGDLMPKNGGCTCGGKC